ncbi:hypothetical protein DCC62_18535 [candidate division KSB1 bacterium]|nr:MAG: hypothetical protein DCC62_18535 [candidate division KSB1 bacterium]
MQRRGGVFSGVIAWAKEILKNSGDLWEKIGGEQLLGHLQQTGVTCKFMLTSCLYHLPINTNPAHNSVRTVLGFAIIIKYLSCCGLAGVRYEQEIILDKFAIVRYLTLPNHSVNMNLIEKKR